MGIGFADDLLCNYCLSSRLFFEPGCFDFGIDLPLGQAAEKQFDSGTFGFLAAQMPSIERP